MASISSNQEFVSVTCGVNTFTVHLSCNELYAIDHNGVKLPKGEQLNIGPRSCVDSEDIGIGLLCSDISSQKNLLAFCTYTKLLCVVCTKTPGIVDKVYQLARGASKVKFTPSGRSIVLADKSGDVYLYDLEGNSNSGLLILGHLSMLLDLLITADEQLIITCDRDEKIRVSRFPNAYNIVTYCLGHREFVSSIFFLPSYNNFLVSTSGDGTVRFWDYKYGKEIAVCDASSYFEKDEDDVIETVTITDAVSFLSDSFTSFVCISLENVNTCLIFKCVFTSYELGLQCSLHQKITFEDSSPWKLSLNAENLWIVLNSNNKIKVSAKKLDKQSGIFVDTLPEKTEKCIQILNGQNMGTDIKKNIVDLLFKRKFENVQEYLSKKEERMAMLDSSNKKLKN